MSIAEGNPGQAESQTRAENHRIWNAISKILLYGGVAVAGGAFLLGGGLVGALPGAGMAVVGKEMNNRSNREAANTVFSAAKSN